MGNWILEFIYLFYQAFLFPCHYFSPLHLKLLSDIETVFDT